MVFFVLMDDSLHSWEIDLIGLRWSKPAITAQYDSVRSTGSGS